MTVQNKRDLFNSFQALEEAWDDFKTLIRQNVNSGEFQRIKHTWLLNVEADLGIGDAVPNMHNASDCLEKTIGIDLDEARSDNFYFDRLEEDEDEEES